MRIYLNPPQPSRGLQRIADALTRHRPSSVEVVNSTDDADFVILYAIGRCEQLTAQARRLWLEQKKHYAVIQCCLRSTQKPHVTHWRELWHNATVVWSYYDLNRAVVQDGGSPAVQLHNFYHAPLGADSRVFYPHRYDGNERIFTIVSSGLSRLSESVRECQLAAQESGGEGVHLGSKINGILSYDDLTDDEVANLYSSSKYVSGLRRKEGFELPAVEGLLCGSRPVVFNTADYHSNYGEFAEYIEEVDRQGVIDQLVALFRGPYRAVTQSEIEAARERFNWERIIGGFYERIK